jgi:DNA replication protein DnaC
MREVTLQKMKQLRFFGMHDAYMSAVESGNIHQQDHEQFVSLLIESEWDDRYNRRIARTIKNAAFHYRASLEELIYEQSRNIDRAAIEHLSECLYIKKMENILVTGPTGTGKSYLSTALGYQACMEGWKVRYFNINKFFSKLKMAKVEGSYLGELKKLERFNLLILDDFGLRTLDKEDRLIFLEIIEDKLQKGSIIVTSQLPVSKWFDAIGEKTIADAIMDRLAHQSHRIELQGESMRKKMKNIN